MEELRGVFAVAFAEDGVAEGAADGGIEHAFFLEAREGVRIEHLGPFVAVVGGGVADGAAEKMAETARHGRGLGLQRHEIAFERLARGGVEICAFGGGVLHVQIEVQFAKAELAHDVAGAAVVFGGDHLLKQTRGDGLAAFVMLREEIEALAFPAEVFHQLRGQLDEVPVNTDAIERGNFDVAAELVQQVAELMENGADLVVREQRWAIADGRGHVAADEAEMEAAIVFATRRDAHFEVVHPSAAALRIARMPVGVEGADVDVFFVAHFVEFHLRMPDLDGAGLAGLHADGRRGVGLAGLDVNRLTRGDAEVKDTLGEGEHASENLIEREVGTELFLIEVELGLPLLFGPIRDLPGLEEVRGFVLSIGAEFLQLDGFTREGIFDAGMEVLDETERAAAGLGHAVREDVIGEIRAAHDLRLFMAEAEDFPNEIGVVMRTAADASGAFPNLAADGLVFEVFHDRDHGGSLQGEAPDGFLVAAEIFRLRLSARGVDGRLREAFELVRIVDEEFPCVRGVEDVFGILLSGLGELGLEFFDALLFLRREIGAGLDEALHGLSERALLHGRELHGLLGFAVGDEQVPEMLVEWDFRKETADLRKHGVVRLAQRGGVAQRVEMLDEAPAFIQLPGGFIEREHDAFEGQLAAILLDHGVQLALRKVERLSDVRLNMVRRERGPAEMKIRLKEGVGHGCFLGGWGRRVWRRCPRAQSASHLYFTRKMSQCYPWGALRFQIGIPHALRADGGAVSVAGKDDCGIVERHQFLHNAGDEPGVRAAWEIRASHAALEEHIAAKNGLFRLMMETHAVRRMARDVQKTPNLASGLQSGFSLQNIIHLKRRHVHAHTGNRAEEQFQRQIPRIGAPGHNPAAKLTFQRRSIHDVIKVLMREQEHIRLHTEPAQPVGGAFRRIDDERAAGEGEQVGVRGGDSARVDARLDHDGRDAGNRWTIQGGKDRIRAQIPSYGPFTLKCL